MDKCWLGVFASCALVILSVFVGVAVLNNSSYVGPTSWKNFVWSFGSLNVWDFHVCIVVFVPFFGPVVMLFLCIVIFVPFFGPVVMLFLCIVIFVPFFGPVVMLFLCIVVFVPFFGPVVMLFLYIVVFVPFFGPVVILWLFKHRARAMVTQTASVSLNIFTHSNP